MVRASESEHAKALPWLDPERAVIIGINAALGDDLFIALDYRTKASDPRVVADQFRRAPGARAEDYVTTWFQVADSCSEFIRLLGL